MQMLDVKCLRNRLPVYNREDGVSSSEMLEEYLECSQVRLFTRLICQTS